MSDRVLVDTCIWATVFSKPNSVENAAIDQLLSQDRVVLVGPVVAEVLYGFRRHEQADWAASRLKASGWIEIEWDDWRGAAAIGRELASRGKRLPLTDLVIAAIAQRHGVSVDTVDPHFDDIDGLKRFSPKP